MNQEDAIDIVALMRMIARDELGGKTTAVWGYVNSFNPVDYTVTVRLATYQVTASAANPSGSVITPPIPLGSPYAGNNYGLECYPEANTPCLVIVVDSDSGSSCSAVLLHNTVIPPVGGLQPGELQIVSKGGSKLKFRADGKLVANGGNTPAAVEGSTITHHHGLAAFFTAVAAECATYISANPPTATSMGVNDLAAIFAALKVTMGGPPVTGTDAAGGGLSLTPAAVDSGQGAQDVLLPSAGGS